MQRGPDGGDVRKWGWAALKERSGHQPRFLQEVPGNGQFTDLYRFKKAVRMKVRRGVSQSRTGQPGDIPQVVFYQRVMNFFYNREWKNFIVVRIADGYHPDQTDINVKLQESAPSSAPQPG